MAGYSGTPLAKKLGIKERFDVLAVGAPPGYRKVCAVDEIWSGLKLVIRKELR